MEGRKKGRSTGLTGYNVYSNEIRKSLLDSPNPPSFGEISRIIGKKWKAMEKKDRSFYQSKAKRMNKLALKNKSTVIDDDKYDVNVDDADEDDVINLVDEEDDVSAEELCSRRSSRVKKSPVVYQASTLKPKTPKAPPKSYTTKTPSSTPRRNLRHEVDLHMQCDDEELSYAQVAAMEAARREHEKANDLIKEFRAGHILVPSSQQNTFLLTTKVTPTTSTAPTTVPVVSPEPTSGNIGLPPPRPAQFLNKQQNEFSRSSGTNTQPDIILVGENLPSSRGNLGTSLIHSTLQSPIIPMASTTPGHGQPLYKFVPTTVTQTLVQNQWAVRPLLKASLQQPGGMITAQSITLGSLPIAQTAGGIANMTSIKQPIQSVAPGQKRPGDSPSNPQKKKFKPGDDNWIPLDEYYYGTHEGDVSYTEEKGEYRFKCWYCSKMLYNNVRAMQHIQGHIDASKQQNIDLSDLTQCKHCYKQFDTPFDMQTHVEKVHLSNKVLMCRICERDFATQHDLMQHMKAMHKICEMPYVCQLCNFRSSMYSDVVDHFKKKHDSSHHLLCLYCLRSFEVKFVNQGWGQTQTYYGHLLKHQTKSSMKRCNTCRLTFFNSADVKNHRKNCHDSNPMHMQGQCSRLDTGVQQKKGSTLKSLNAPSISRIQDYGEIIFPAATKNMKCVECKIPMSSTDHYKKYIHCTMCRFATSCSVAYANHMMGFHSGQMSSLNLNIPWERPMKETMYCECNFSSKYGNKIADHLVHCMKWTSYSSKPLKIPSIMPPVITVPSSDDTKQEGSILGMLGLRKTPSDSSSVDNKPKTEASVSKVESQKVKTEEMKNEEEEESTKVDKKDQDDTAMESDENKETKESEISPKSVEGSTDATKDAVSTDSKTEDIAESSDSTKESEQTDKEDDKVATDKDGSTSKSEEKESAVVDDDDNDDDECAIIETGESNKAAADGKDKMEEDVIDLDSEEVDEKDKSEEKSGNVDSEEVSKKVADITDDGDDGLENAGTSQKMGEDEPEIMDITEEKSEDAEKISDASKEKLEEADMVDESVVDEKLSENLDDNMETTKETAENDENVIGEDNDDVDDEDEKATEDLDADKTAGGEDKTEELEEESKDAAADDDGGDDESVNKDDMVESDVKESGTSQDVVDVDVDPQSETKSDKKELNKEETIKKAEEAGSNTGGSKDEDSKVETDKAVDQPAEAKKETSVNVKESPKDDKPDTQHRRESSQDRRESSHDRDRHDNRSHDHRRDNRSHRPDHSSSGSRSHGGDYRDRSYDRDRGDRDHDRSWDRDRGRDRDHSRNQDYNRSGGGYHDNRDRGYRGHQGQGQHGGGSGGYHGNRDYQDRNRGGGGGGHHRQDRGGGYHQRNPNQQNRGGYNQNYRGGYRGGYY